MPTETASIEAHTLSMSSLVRHYEGIRAAMRIAMAEREVSGPAPTVPFDLPDLDEDLTAFLDTEVSVTNLGERNGGALHLLNLMADPHTRTTKTMASLVMVARAVRHIRETGDRILIVTPTSGNKGTALRAAVAKAYRTGIADPDHLRIAVVVPEQSLRKLRSSPLLAAGDNRTRNPVFLAVVPQAAGVKELLAGVVADRQTEILTRTGFRLWYSLDLDNYRIADAARAFVEAEALPITAGSRPRIHAHAVSSAYGLLGYHLGHRTLATGAYDGLPQPAAHPGFFLVQQLATPDMVLSLAKGRVDRADLPHYRRDTTSGLWRQDTDPLFPAVTSDPGEQIDATFYSSNPPTSALINPLIARYGGGGVVVSRQECLDRYPAVREMLAPAGVRLPDDVAELREWSLVKAATGVLVGIERSLLAPGTDIVLHASGHYTDDLVPPMPPEHVPVVRSADELAALLLAAARA